jgi:hypothetical protein
VFAETRAQLAVASMHFFTTCCILTTLAAAANAPVDPVASEVYRCDFEADTDRNYDAWPDGWTRRSDRHHPDYVQIGIVPTPSDLQPRPTAPARPEGAAEVPANPLRPQCLSIELDGGAGEVSSPLIPISVRYSFILEGRIRTRGLKHDAARMKLSLYDEQGSLLETHDSPATQSNDWKASRVGPVSTSDSRVRFAKISLILRPQEVLEDLTGVAYFDDLRLLQVPRMKLRTAAVTGLYHQPGAAEVICEVSGVSEPDPRVTFELLDYEDRVLATHSVAVRPTSPVARTTKSGKAIQEPFAGSAGWHPPANEYGFYRVRVKMALVSGAVLERSVTFAVLRPLGRAASGEFGWSLPGGEEPMPLEELGPLLGEVGIHWAKFPVWYRNPDDAWTDRLAWFAERLSLQGIEMVGLLDHPPTKPGAEEPNDQPPIASLFIEQGIWDDAVEPLMTRLSLKVRWWQLGGDDDTSFVGLPDVDAKIADAKQQFSRFGQEIRLGIPWRWTNEPPRNKRVPWEFLSLITIPPLTADEMALYLDSGKPPVAPTVAAESPKAQLVSAPTTNPTTPAPIKTTATTRKREEAAIVPPKRWIILEPLKRSAYSPADRLQDLVMRMLAAKIHGADAVFVPQPFSNDYGLMNDDGTPSELLVPWRTIASTISGAEYIGQIELPSGSTNHVFARGNEAFLVIWNDQPTHERLSLGDDLRQMDLWGRDLAVERAEADGRTEHVIAVAHQPTIVSGLNQAVARLQVELAFDNTRLASIFGREQPLTMRFRNHFGTAIAGEIAIRSPKSWDINPRLQRFKLAEGDELKQTFPVLLQSDATSGQQQLEIDFEVVSDKTYRFRVYRQVSLGLEGIALEMKTRLQGDNLIVEQTISNLTDSPVSFQCMLFPPGRRRETKQVIDLTKGRLTVAFTLPEGEKLLGQTIRLRAEEIGGARVLNSAVVAER